MRVLVVVLLIADSLLLIWGLARGGDRTLSEAPAAPLPFGVEELRLLSEVGARGSSPGTVRELQGGICVRVGPLVLEEDASAVMQRARSLGLPARSDSLEVVAGPPDLQVHLPPLPSAEQASRAVREFAALDIEAYVIPDGDLAGGVSLGTFTSEDEAEARRADVASLGYPVRIVEIFRTRLAWQVQLRGRDAREIDAFLLGLVADWPDLASSRIPCGDAFPAGDAIDVADESGEPSRGAGRGAPTLPRIARPPEGEDTPP